MVADPRPVAKHADLADLGAAVDLDPAHCLRLGPELFFPERFAARRQEDDVVRHEVEHGGEIARFARRHPGFDDLANGFFVANRHRPKGYVSSSPLSTCGSLGSPLSGVTALVSSNHTQQSNCLGRIASL